MVCSNKWISSFLQFFIFLGSFVGEIGMAYVADNYGRKLSENYSWIITIVGVFILIISPNLEFVALGTFMAGLGVNGTTNIHYTFLK